MKATRVTIVIYEDAEVSVRNPHRYPPEPQRWLSGGYIGDVEFMGDVPSLIGAFRTFADKLEAELEAAKAAETFHVPPDTPADETLTPCEVEA